MDNHVAFAERDVAVSDTRKEHQDNTDIVINNNEPTKSRCQLREATSARHLIEQKQCMEDISNWNKGTIASAGYKRCGS